MEKLTKKIKPDANSTNCRFKTNGLFISPPTLLKKQGPIPVRWD
jgi:hypothetical protein